MRFGVTTLKVLVLCLSRPSETAEIEAGVPPDGCRCGSVYSRASMTSVNENWR